MEIEVKITGVGTEKLFTIAMQPGLVEKIILCQEKVMNEGRESMTGEEINTEKDDKGIMRYSYRIWVPNVQELKDEILDENHISRKYHRDTRHIVEYEQEDMQPDLTCVEQPVRITDQKEQVLQNKVIKLVRVLWQNHNVEESAWELESAMLEKYLHLFSI
ncbi:hypothetical protein AgCh_031570 [Apium graveolens]